MINNDQALLALIKTTAAEYGYSPHALLTMAASAAKWSSTAVIPNFGPSPQSIGEAEISPDILAVWPEWVAELVPPGSKWERLQWPDGSITIRLVNHQALVLAARNFTKDESGKP